MSSRSAVNIGLAFVVVTEPGKAEILGLPQSSNIENSVLVERILNIIASAWTYLKIIDSGFR